jgi:hypothetical protein
MKRLIQGIMVIVTVIPFIIGYLCYTISISCFKNFLIFGVPMIIVRFVHMLLMMPKTFTQWKRD